MITLKTLDQHTAQEIFDQVAKHLLTQNAVSVDAEEWNCLYRTSNGLKCAVGCLIADEEYDIKMENRSVGCLIYCDVSKHLQLLKDLQEVHDHFETTLWKTELFTVTQRHNLNLMVLYDNNN